MAAYADYVFYSETYLGSAVTEADFPRLSLRASAVIDQITFQRAATVVEAAEDTDLIAMIKMATCAVAEEINTFEANGSEDGIQSERVGEHSVTYAASSSRQLPAQQKYRDSAKVYLGGTGLMFQGFATGEYGG